MRLGLCTIILLAALAVLLDAQQRVQGTNGPAEAIPVRCVNVAGTEFEACGGTSGAGTAVSGVHAEAEPNDATNLFVLPALAEETAPSPADGQKVSLSVDLGSNLRTTAKVLDASGNALVSDVADPPSNARGLFVRLVQGQAVAVSGTFWQATQPVSLNQTGANNDVDVLTLPAITGSVTANAGTNLNTSALALSATQTDRSQKTQLTDGTRDGTVKAASTLPLLTDTAIVTTQRDPLPAGTNVLGHVIVDTTSTTAVTQATGTNLHAVLDATSTTAVTQATASNLNAAVVGTGTAGSPAGNILTVQGVASMTKILVTPDALPANQSVNLAQVGGTNTVTGGVAGILAVGGNVANGVAATANPVPVGGIFTTTPVTLTTGQTATAQFTAAQNLKQDLTTIAGTAPTTAGKVDVKGADGDVFVRQTTAANLNMTATPIALTKGTQGATGFSTQDLKDAGRTAISFYANNFASGATTVEKIITWDQSKGTGAITAATASYTITSGKTLRITALSVGTRGHLTATAQTTTFALRLNTAGACVVTSTPILFAAQSATPATALAWDRVIIPIPDGYEIAGNGTIALCITGNSTFATNAPTWAVNLVGFEY